MHPLTQILIGMAAAGVVAGPQRPSALIAGAVAGVLPDLIDWWQQQVFRQPDITVIPDPLAPAPATVAQGLRLALHHARASGRPCVVRLNPLPAPGHGFAPYRLDCDRRHQLVIAQESGGQTAPVNRPGTNTPPAGSMTPFHPLPLRITDRPLDLHLDVLKRRIESRDLNEVTGVGHGVPALGVLVIVAAIANLWCGLAVAAALTAHLLCEAGNRRELMPWAPLSSHRWPGRRLWNEASWRANVGASVLACAVIAAFLCAGR